MIRVGEWLPDIPDLENPGALEALNVVPKSAVSYGPWRLPVNVSNALDERALGAFSGADYQGNVFTFAGDAGKLYRYSGNTYTDVSKVGGYSTAPGYVEVTSRAWNFQQFNNIAFTTNFSDPIQKWVMGTDSIFADAGTTIPKGRFLSVVGQFLVVGNTEDTFDGAVALRVWWSPIGNPLNDDWGNTDLQSDLRTLPKGIRITGLAGGQYGVIFTETTRYVMTYAGPPTIFSIDEIEGDTHGCIAPGSLVQAAGSIFYLSGDGFQRMSGSQAVPIGQDKVDETFFAELDRSNLGRIVATVDLVRQLYIVAYPGEGSTSGRPNKLLIYNYYLNRWSKAEAGVQIIESLRSESLTVEALGAIYTFTDDVPGLTDSPQWSGGTDYLACFNSTNEMCSFTGVNAAATVDTTEITGDLGGKFVARRVRPLTDSSSVTVRLGSRNFQDETPVFTGQVPRHPATGLCKFRSKARYHRARIETPEGWLGTQIFGVDSPGSDDR